jgi:hypothetical protein
MPLRIELVSGGPDFAISAEVEMPNIRLRVVGPELTASIVQSTIFEWLVKLSLNAGEVRNGPARVVEHPDISASVRGPEYTPQFQKVRGGKLVISVRARVANQPLTASLSEVGGRPMRIIGTNPSGAQLRQAISRRLLRLMVRNESGGRQFQDGLPLFSSDLRGGVGLLQITSPRPTDDEIWDWRANVAAATRLFNEKLAIAKAYPRKVRASARFQTLVQEFNKRRKDAGKPELRVQLPDFTEQQAELDGVRGFNGYAGDDGFLGPRNLHEFRVPLEVTPQQTRLSVTEAVDGVTGSVDWQRVPAGDRPMNGSYVANVLAKPDF